MAPSTSKHPNKFLNYYSMESRSQYEAYNGFSVHKTLEQFKSEAAAAAALAAAAAAASAAAEPAAAEPAASVKDSPKTPPKAKKIMVSETFQHRERLDNVWDLLNEIKNGLTGSSDKSKAMRAFYYKGVVFKSTAAGALKDDTSQLEEQDKKVQAAFTNRFPNVRLRRFAGNTYGMTHSRFEGDGDRPIVYLNYNMCRIVDDEACGKIKKSHITVLFLVTVYHELAHCLQGAISDGDTPPRPDKSKSGVRNEKGESGYNLEDALFGGIITPVWASQKDVDEGNFGKVRRLWFQKREDKDENEPQTWTLKDQLCDRVVKEFKDSKGYLSRLELSESDYKVRHEDPEVPEGARDPSSKRRKLNNGEAQGSKAKSSSVWVWENCGCLEMED